MTSVALSDPITLDLEVYLLWLHGFSIDQIVKHRLKKYNNPAQPNAPATPNTSTRSLPPTPRPSTPHQHMSTQYSATQHNTEVYTLLLRDTRSQCNTMEYVERFLKEPVRMFQMQMCRHVKLFLLSKYYRFDDKVVRELLGRKLTSRAGKDLDEVSEISNVALRSCRRQFQNLRAIFNFLDDRNFEGEVCLELERAFQIPPDLAKRYAAIVFLLHNRFTIQSNKKKTAFLSTADFEYFACLLLCYWAKNPEFIFDSSEPYTPKATDETLTATDHNKTQHKLNNATQHSGTKSQGSMDELGLDNELLLSSRTDKSGSPVFSALSSRAIPSFGRSPAFRSQSTSKSSTAFDLDPIFTSHLRDIKAVIVGNKSGFDVMHRKIMVKLNTIKVTRKEEEDHEQLSAEVEPKLTDTQTSGQQSITQPTTPRIKSVVLDHITRTTSENDSTKGTNKTENKEPKQKRQGQSPNDSVNKRNEELLNWAENSYKSWSKNLCLLGAGLAQAKELRDLFEDVLAMVAEPLREMSPTKQMLEDLFTVTSQVGKEVCPSEEHEQHWNAFVFVVGRITMNVLGVG